jgi:hypothetical protein
VGWKNTIPSPEPCGWLSLLGGRSYRQPPKEQFGAYSGKVAISSVFISSLFSLLFVCFSLYRLCQENSSGARPLAFLTLRQSFARPPDPSVRCPRALTLSVPAACLVTHPHTAWSPDAFLPQAPSPFSRSPASGSLLSICTCALAFSALGIIVQLATLPVSKDETRGSTEHHLLSGLCLGSQAVPSLPVPPRCSTPTHKRRCLGPPGTCTVQIVCARYYLPAEPLVLLCAIDPTGRTRRYSPGATERQRQQQPVQRKPA